MPQHIPIDQLIEAANEMSMDDIVSYLGPREVGMKFLREAVGNPDKGALFITYLTEEDQARLRASRFYPSFRGAIWQDIFKALAYLLLHNPRKG